MIVGILQKGVVWIWNMRRNGKLKIIVNASVIYEDKSGN